MTTGTALLTALIAAATAVVVAVVTQLVTWRRERSLRTYDRRRSALLDAQDAALALRNRFSDFGEVAQPAYGARPDAEGAAAQRWVDDALAALAVRMSRVDDEAVVLSVRTWRERARFNSISSEEVTAAEELKAWEAMNADFGAALFSATGRLTPGDGPTRGSIGSS